MCPVFHRQAATFRDEISDNGSDFDCAARLRTVRGDSQDPSVDGFDLLNRLFSFEFEQRITLSNGVAILLQPAGENTFLHRPTQTWNRDFVDHNYSFTNRRMAAVISAADGTTAASSGGL